LLLALVGGAAAAILTTGGDDPPATTIGRPEQVTVTKRETRTTQGNTVTETVVVTTTPAAPPPTAPAVSGSVSIDEAVALTDQATFALRRGDWSGAASLARRAYQPLAGTYSDGFRYEAYVNYDLGKALAELGRCEQALRYLDRSETLQGSRGEIDDARAGCGG
jgi:Flp pilus assembly protein TadD